MKKLLLSLSLCAMAMSASAQDYYVVGEFQGDAWPATWNLETAPQMVEQADGTFVLEVAEMKSSFKILKAEAGEAPAWGDDKEICAPNATPFQLDTDCTVQFGGSNIEFTPSPITNATLVFNPEAMTLRITGTVGAGSEVQTTKWYVCGAFQDWKPAEAPEMVYNSANGRFELSLAEMKSGFKIINARAWGQGEWGSIGGAKVKIGEAFQLTNSNGGDIAFEYDLLKNVTLSLDADTSQLYVTGIPDESLPELMFVGSFCDWNLENAPVFELDDTTAVYTIASVDLPESYEFKITAAGWAPQWGTYNNADMSDEKSTIVADKKQGNDPANITSTISGECTVTFGYYTGEVTIVSKSNGIENVTVAGEAVYYNLQGVRVANPQGGIFIKVAGDKVSKVVR